MMTTNYKSSRDVPMETIIGRLNELSDAVTRGHESMNREFIMRIPAECDRDADLVIGDAAIRLDRLQADNEALRARVAELESCVDDGASVWDDYLCTGGGSPVAHGKFVRAAKAFIAKAQSLRQQDNNLETKNDDKN